MTAIAPSGPRAEGVRWDLSRIVEDAAAARSAARRVAAPPATRSPSATAAASRSSTAPGWPPRWTSSRRSTTPSAASAPTPACAARSTSTTTRRATSRRSSSRAPCARSNTLRFFELEWIALDDDRAAARCVDAPEVARDRHHLRRMRRYRPHTPAGGRGARCWPSAARRRPTAWQNLFEQTVANVRAPLRRRRGRARPHGRRAARVRPPPERRAAPAARWRRCHGALEPLDADAGALLRQPRRRPAGRWTGCATTDEPMAARDLDNELDPAAVDAMMQAIETRYAIAQRWFRHKAGLLGVDRARAGRPVRAARRAAAPCSYEEARGVVRSAFARLLGARSSGVARAFFDERRVDAEPRQGKRGGAFCASVAQDAEPYILLNYTDTLRDVMTIAHELGHGMHFVYSGRRQTALSHHAPLALCRGAVDVRRADRLRPHAGDGAGPRRRARRWCAASSSRASRPSSARR